MADKSLGNFMWRGGEGSITTKDVRLVMAAKPGQKPCAPQRTKPISKRFCKRLRQLGKMRNEYSPEKKFLSSEPANLNNTLVIACQKSMQTPSGLEAAKPLRHMQRPEAILSLSRLFLAHFS